MNLEEVLLAEHSKQNCDKVVRWVGNSQQRFDELLTLFMDGSKRINQLAAWPLSYSAIANPGLVSKHWNKLLKNLRKPGIHDAIKRNTVRLMQDMEIPEKHRGLLMTICFDYVTDPGEKPATKAFSLTVLGRLAKTYPEIRPELKLIIETQWDNESAAFRSRAKKILPSLK